MNTHTFSSARAICLCLLSLGSGLLAHDGVEERSIGPRADSHAPIGVMGDHLHRKGEYMVSARHMTMSMDGQRVGENKLATHEVFQRGFFAAATGMDMNMQMLGLMYAPSDRVTLMGMAMYVDSEMEMVADPNAEAGEEHHGSGGHATMAHGASGWGDLSVTALVRGWERGESRMHWNLGVSVPTGSVSERMGGQYLPYGMQLGSGTWDAKLGATFSQRLQDCSVGAQILGTVRLEDVGESGFGRSDALESSVWASWSPHRFWSLSGRIKYSAEGALSGHYDGPHGHSAPPHFQQNYGGDVLEAGLGLTRLWNEGALRGHRLAIEYLRPVYQQLNGVGMDRGPTLTIGWQRAW